MAPPPLPCAPLPTASLEPETKACSGRKVRPVGMCAGAWLAGPDKKLRLPVNQLEVLEAGGDRAGWHHSQQPLPAPLRASPNALVQVRKGFMANAGLVERKGCSSCATLATPALLRIFRARAFLAPANLGFSRGHVTLRLSLGMWDVWGFWKLKVSPVSQLFVAHPQGP